MLMGTRVIGRLHSFENQRFLPVFWQLVHSFSTYGQVIHEEKWHVNNLRITCE
jgi:hypothetical protein